MPRRRTSSFGAGGTLFREVSVFGYLAWDRAREHFAIGLNRLDVLSRRLVSPGRIEGLQGRVLGGGHGIGLPGIPPHRKLQNLFHGGPVLVFGRRFQQAGGVRLLVFAILRRSQVQRIIGSRKNVQAEKILDSEEFRGQRIRLIEIGGGHALVFRRAVEGGRVGRGVVPQTPGDLLQVLAVASGRRDFGDTVGGRGNIRNFLNRFENHRGFLLRAALLSSNAAEGGSDDVRVEQGKLRALIKELLEGVLCRLQITGVAVAKIFPPLCDRFHRFRKLFADLLHQGRIRGRLGHPQGFQFAGKAPEGIRVFRFRNCLLRGGQLFFRFLAIGFLARFFRQSAGFFGGHQREIFSSTNAIREPSLGRDGNS